MFAATAFGLLTAFTFATPAIGRALSVDPAALFRMIDASETATPGRWWAAAAAGCTLTALLVLVFLPDPLFGLGFIAVAGLLLALLDVIVRGLRWCSTISAQASWMAWCMHLRRLRMLPESTQRLWCWAASARSTASCCSAVQRAGIDGRRATSTN